MSDEDVLSKTTSLLEEWEFRVTGKDFFFVGRIFLKGDENAATLLFTQHTHLCSHTKTLFNNTDPIWSVPRKIVFAPVVLLLLVSGGDVRRARTHRDAADTRRRRERERERERERDENL